MIGKKYTLTHVINTFSVQKSYVLITALKGTATDNGFMCIEHGKHNCCQCIYFNDKQQKMETLEKIKLLFLNFDKQAKINELT